MGKNAPLGPLNVFWKLKICFTVTMAIPKMVECDNAKLGLQWQHQMRHYVRGMKEQQRNKKRKRGKRETNLNESLCGGKIGGKHEFRCMKKKLDEV